MAQGWNTAESSLPVANALGAAATHGNWLYSLGGTSDVATPASGLRTAILKARVQPDGSLMPWKQIGLLPVARVSPAVIVSDIGKMYIIGGTAGDVTPDAGDLQVGQSVLVATLNQDGDIQGPLVAGPSLPVSLQGADVAKGREYLYVIGGQSQNLSLDFSGQDGNFAVSEVVTGLTSGATGTVMAQTDGGATGTLKLKLTSGAFVDDEILHGSLLGRAVANGVLGATKLDFDGQTGNFTVGQVITGGTSGATATISAQVDGGATGTLTLTGVTGTFQDNETITDPITGSAAVNGVLYKELAFDGQTGNFTVGEVVTGGTSGATMTIDSQTDAGATGTIVGARQSGTFVNGENLYGSLGGSAVLAAVPAVSALENVSVLRARLQGGGELGPWEEIGVLPDQDSARNSIAVDGEMIYCLSSGILYWAKADGSRLEAWQQMKAPADIVDAKLLILDSFLLILGGTVTGTAQRKVHVIALASTGPNGAWFRTADMPAAVVAPGMALREGEKRVYLVGGHASTTESAKVRHAQILNGVIGAERIL